LTVLHRRQIEQLAAWRAAGHTEDPNDPLLGDLLLTTNALTAGLRAVG
jgi:hypothetical protein